jgi:phosphoglycolate phosphatase
LKQKLIIFDLDGTLYQTHITSVIATQELLKDLYLPEVSEEKIISLFGEPTEIFCQKIAPTADINIIKQIENQLTEYEKRHIKKSGKLYDGIENLLQTLITQGYTLAIVSNGSEQYINCVLETCNIINMFPYIRGRKPDKSKTDNIKELLLETKADWAAVVGDRIHDIEAAKSNSLVSIGVRHGYGKEEVASADFVANNAKEVLSIINRCTVFCSIENMFERKDPNKALILGVNGVDTSGKTQFSIALNIYLKARGYRTTLIHLDDFHNPSKIRSQGANPIDSYINNAFNLELLKNEILAPLKQGQDINKELNLLDLDKDTYTNNKHFDISKNNIVILEGVLLYREPINEYFDCKIFLDISFEEVIKRATLRDVPKYGDEFLERYKQKYIPIQQWYLEKYNPKTISQCVIDNTDYNTPQIANIK